MMRFDNGRPWGDPVHRMPTALALWLVGLGIQPLFGRPRQSTDNAVVERGHGVLNGWVEPQQCADAAMLAARLEQFACLQRDVYPVQQQQPRQECFPELAGQPRRYCRQDEVQQWSLAAVFAYVARYVFSRRVEKNGRITVMTREYSLGRQYRAQSVTVQLEPQTAHWLVKDRHGTLVGSFSADQLTYPTLAGLNLVYRQAKKTKVVVAVGGA